MNVLTRFGALALAAIGVGCGASTEPDVDSGARLMSLPAEVVLRHGEQVRIQEGALRLTFLRVTEDSRCPEDVTCVWEGNAAVRIGATAGTGPSETIDLNTAEEPRAVQWRSVRITLLEVRPARQSETPPKAEDYSIRLRIESLE